MSIRKCAKSNKSFFLLPFSLVKHLAWVKKPTKTCQYRFKVKHLTNLLWIQRLLECSHNSNRRRTKLLLQTMLDEVSQVETDTERNIHLLSKSDSMLA